MKTEHFLHPDLTLECWNHLDCPFDYDDNKFPDLGWTTLGLCNNTIIEQGIEQGFAKDHIVITGPNPDRIIEFFKEINKLNPNLSL